MPNLHPQIQKALEAMARLDLQPLETLSPPDARRQMEVMAASRRAEPLPIASTEDRAIPGLAGDIPVRIYRPNAAGVLPAIVYFHGGGHVIGGLDSHDLIARNLCGGAEAIIVSIDYRMGPEHRFPAAVDDSFAALEWVHANAASLGADPDRLGVHGDSAGANLAAVVAIMARDKGGPKLGLQSLVYPVADFRMGTESYKTFETGYGILTAGAMRWFRGHYLRTMDDALDWRASPVLAPDLSGVAPAIVIAAECDVLHDEGLAYSDRLKAAGVPVERHEYAGMIHAFFGMMPAVDDAMNAQRAVWAAFKRAFA